MKQESSVPFFPLNEKKDSFMIRPLARFISRDSFYEPPHRHNYQEIIYVKSGSGKHRIDDQEIPFSNNTFYLIQEGQIHQFIEGTGLDGYIIRFTREFFPSMNLEEINPYNLTRGHFGPILISPDAHEIPQFDALVQMIHDEYESPVGSFKKRGVLQHLLSILVIRLERFRRTRDMEDAKSTDNHQRQLFLRFIDVLDQKFKEQHKVAYYARSLGVRSRVLSSICKTISGHTAKKFILNRLISEAKRYLRFTNMSLKEIAFQLGFDSPAYFSRIFKEQAGMTPKSYQMKKKQME